MYYTLKNTNVYQMELIVATIIIFDGIKMTQPTKQGVDQSSHVIAPIEKR